MNVMDLVAKISLDSAEYEKGIGEAKSSFSGLGSAITSGAKTIGKAGVAAFTAIGGAIGGATTALIANAKETAAYADNIDKMSQKMGFTTDAFQEWDFIMQHNGSSIEAVKSSMLKLDKALESDTDAWDKLGLSQEQLLSMSPEEKFEATVKALQGVTDENEKAALAQDIFGKSYQEMMPLLNQTAEETEAMKQQVHDLGGVMSEDAVKAGAQFQDSLQNLKTSLTGAKNTLMGEFLPSLSTVMDGMAKLFSGDDSGIGQIKQGIEDFATKLNERLPKVLETVGGIAESLISALPQFFNVIAQQLPSLISTLIPVLINAVVGLADAIVESLPQIMAAIQSNINTITQGLTKIMSAIGKIILKLVPTLLPMMIKVGIELIKSLVQGFTENSSEVISTIFQLIDEVVTLLTEPETLTALLECGIQLVLAIAQGILENLPQLLSTMFTVLENVVGFLIKDGIPMILKAAVELFTSIGQGALDAGAKIIEKIGELLGKILGFEGLGKWFTDIYNNALGIFENIGNAVSNAFNSIQTALTEFGEKIWNGIKDGIGDMFEHGKKLVEQIVKGIKSVWHTVTEALNPKTGSGASDIVSKYKEMGAESANAYVEGQESPQGFDIHSPSKKMAYVGRMVIAGLNEGMDEEEVDPIKIDPLELDATASIKGKGNGSGRSRTDNKIDQLLEMMAEIVNNREGITVPVFVGGRQIDEVYVDSKNRVTVRSGGQVSV